MSCHFQGTIFTKDKNGAFQSTNDCQEAITTDGLPQLTEKGLVNTEENQRQPSTTGTRCATAKPLAPKGTTRYNECGDSLGRNSKD